MPRPKNQLLALMQDEIGFVNRFGLGVIDLQFKNFRQLPADFLLPAEGFGLGNVLRGEFPLEVPLPDNQVFQIVVKKGLFGVQSAQKREREPVAGLAAFRFLREQIRIAGRENILLPEKGIQSRQTEAFSPGAEELCFDGLVPIERTGKERGIGRRCEVRLVGPQRARSGEGEIGNEGKMTVR